GLLGLKSLILGSPTETGISGCADEVDFRLDGKRWTPGRFSARPCNVTRLSHSISRGRRPVNSFIASRLYSAEVFSVPAIAKFQRRSCAHRCPSELAILRPARLT